MKLFLIIFAALSFQLRAENVRVEYKKYESIDLGGLEIKGSIIAPGDISIRDRDRNRLKRNLLERYSFDQEVKSDVKSLR